MYSEVLFFFAFFWLDISQISDVNQYRFPQQHLQNFNLINFELFSLGNSIISSSVMVIKGENVMKSDFVIRIGSCQLCVTYEVKDFIKADLIWSESSFKIYSPGERKKFETKQQQFYAGLLVLYCHISAIMVLVIYRWLLISRAISTRRTFLS